MAPYGQHFGKDDYERYGIFAEMTYLHGMGYTGATPMPGTRDLAGRQMYPGAPKMKTGLQDCYFDKKYKRLFVGEGLPRKIKETDKQDKKGNLVFRPPSKTHMHSTPGDFYGCFTTKMKAFDPRGKKEDPSKDGGKEKFMPTSPGKRGGCGYTNITFSKYPKYIPTAYEPKRREEEKKGLWKPPSPGSYFDDKPYRSGRGSKVTYINTYPAVWARDLFRPPNPSKSLGGCMEGCFSKWPKYIATKYLDPWKLPKYAEELEEKRRRQKGLPIRKEERKEKFVPQSRNKTYPVKSIVDSKAYLVTNNRTWRNIRPVTYTREFI